MDRDGRSAAVSDERMPASDATFHNAAKVTKLERREKNEICIRKMTR